MAITTFYKYPSLSIWQRMLKRLCGGQDFVAVVYVSESGNKLIRWLTGVDMENPIDLWEVPEQKERH